MTAKPAVNDAEPTTRKRKRYPPTERGVRVRV